MTTTTKYKRVLRQINGLEMKASVYRIDIDYITSVGNNMGS